MNKIKILHTESKDYCRKAKDILNSFANVDYFNIDRHKILKRVAAYDALIVRLRNAVDHEVIQKGKKLKVIATATTGINHIDEQAVKSRKIKVISLKEETEVLKTVYSTAEHTFGLILALLRKIPWAREDVLNGHWQNERFRGNELYGKTLGIIGFGRLGHMVAKMGKGFGMKIVVYDSDREKKYSKWVTYRPLNQLLACSDIVTLHIPLNDQTKNFINAHRLGKLKRGAYLINTSRGDILDEKRLLDLLKKKIIGGAALDVLTGEESSDFKVSKHPLVRYAGCHNNLIITPHIGGAALEAVEKTDIYIAKKIKAYFNSAK